MVTSGASVDLLSSNDLLNLHFTPCYECTLCAKVPPHWCLNIHKIVNSLMIFFYDILNVFFFFVCIHLKEPWFARNCGLFDSVYFGAGPQFVIVLLYSRGKCIIIASMHYAVFVQDIQRSPKDIFCHLYVLVTFIKKMRSIDISIVIRPHNNRTLLPF